MEVGVVEVSWEEEEEEEGEIRKIVGPCVGRESEAACREMKGLHVGRIYSVYRLEDFLDKNRNNTF